ncbi:MAG: endopeptidase La [Acidobacteria bacterium]|nr:endopeptidase La [Acidobacteriota bacterium]
MSELQDSNLAELVGEIADLEGVAIDLPEELAVLPLRGNVLFSAVVMPLLVAKPSSVELIEKARRGDRLFVAVALQLESPDDPAAEHLFERGTLARILKTLELPNGKLNVIVQGLARVDITSIDSVDPYFVAKVQLVAPQPVEGSVEIEALVHSVQRQLQRIVKLPSNLPPEVQALASASSDPGSLADLVGAHLNLAVDEKQELLETDGVEARLKLVVSHLARQVKIFELSQKIETDVQDEIDKSQREFYLRERLRAIQRELGEDDEGLAEAEELGRRIGEAKMPEDVEKVARQEVERLARMSPVAAEYNVVRTYIDWLLDVPWAHHTEDNLDIAKAADILDEDHYDLEKIKKRILEYLAVRKLKPDMKGPILCFIGPPGVGKTSLGRSIARALGREFVRISLGGVHDEAEIRGHRRTYVGALPGRIIQGLKRAGSMNPVFMLDEIDKLGNDFRGDPSSALLEVLDPEQNHTFSDHYLEVAADLSKVLFIATGNVPEQIPDALYDRMEILDLPGYTAEEKTLIARSFLVPRQLEEHGLGAGRLRFEPATIMAIVQGYTEEAGVRGLERRIAAICRAVARRVAEQMDDGETATGADDAEEQAVTPADLHGFLGPVQYFSDVAERTARPGVATALAWTPYGGDILFVEATHMPGKGQLTLTGQLGDVMKESAQAALSYLRSRADELGFGDIEFEKLDVHVHIPAGGVPKDGPSAGITMLVALASLLSGKPVRSDMALSGEITLRGLILPVGGIKNKVLAARRAGLKRVILPARNEKDLEEVPEHARDGLEFTFVREIGEVLDIVLCDGPAKATAPTRVKGERRRSRKRARSEKKPPAPKQPS